MKPNIKRVVRTSLWLDPAFDARLAQENDIQLDVLQVDGDTQAALNLLAQAHVYYVSAAKDELPKPWFASGELIAKCPNLICVSSSGAGYDTVDVAQCTAAGIAVVNQAGGNAVSVAEHTFGLILGVSRKMIQGDRRLRREIGYGREAVMGHEICGKTLGLVGIGHVGTRVAQLAHAFGLKVIATDPFLSTQEIEQRGAIAVSFDQLLSESDFVSLHCPRDTSTLNLMNTQTFARMKPGAIFITTSRGGVHNEQALVEALQSGHLAGAGIDVWDQEPPPLDHPLLAMDNVFGTFHTAGVTHECRRNVASIGADQVVAVLAGQKPPRLINPEVWPAYQERKKRLLP